MAKKAKSAAQKKAQMRFKQARKYALDKGAEPFSKEFGRRMKEWYAKN